MTYLVSGVRFQAEHQRVRSRVGLRADRVRGATIVLVVVLVLVLGTERNRNEDEHEDEHEDEFLGRHRDRPYFCSSQSGPETRSAFGGTNEIQPSIVNLSLDTTLEKGSHDYYR